MATLVGLVLLVTGIAGGGLSTESQSDATCPGTDPLCGMDLALGPIIRTIAGFLLLVVAAVLWVLYWKRTSW